MICIFKCPNCGSQMGFLPETQMLFCETCESEMPVSDYNEDDITFEGNLLSDDGEFDDIEELECPSCGSRIITENASNVMIKCGYCGSGLAKIGSRGKNLMPEVVIPLSITLRQAQDHVISWWLSHQSMPNLDMAKMKMEFQDMYIPVWLYDVDTVSVVNAKVEHDDMRINVDMSKGGYKSVKGSDWGRSYADYGSSLMRDVRMDKGRGINFSAPFDHGPEITDSTYTMGRIGEKTNISTVLKILESSFQKIPFLASTHFSTDKFHGIEPYNYYQLKKFKSAYLSGHMAENYELSYEEILPHATIQIKKYALSQCYEHIEGTVFDGKIVKVLEEKVTSYPYAVYYALLPVWICTYYYRGKQHKLYINGQTGKVDGEIFFGSSIYPKDVLAYGISSIFAWMNVTVFADSLTGSPFIAIIFILYLIFRFGKKVFPEKGKTTVDIKEGKMKVKNYLITNITVGFIFLMLNLLIVIKMISGKVSFNGGFILGLIVGFIAVIISTGIFAIKRRKDLVEKDIVEYRDYIRSSGTNVIASVRQ